MTRTVACVIAALFAIVAPEFAMTAPQGVYFAMTVVSIFAPIIGMVIFRRLPKAVGLGRRR